MTSWIIGMDRGYGSPVGPGYRSGPYILSRGHEFHWISHAISFICHSDYLRLAPTSRLLLAVHGAD